MYWYMDAWLYLHPLVGDMKRNGGEFYLNGSNLVFHRIISFSTLVPCENPYTSDH
jgi:hypothetical protein